MTIKDTYATGKTVEQAFYIASLSHPIEAKGVLKIEADLTPSRCGDRDGSLVMGWAPRTLNVTLPDKLSELAGGVKLVTCRYLGGGQIERIQTGAFGACDGAHGTGRSSRSLKAIRDKEQRDEDAETLSITKLEVMAQTALDKLLIEYPPDLVCAQGGAGARRVCDGNRRGAVLGGRHAPGRAQACRRSTVLRASGLVPETET